MEKIKLMVDIQPFTSKPTSKETACIKKRFTNSETLRELSANKLFELISKGHTYIPAVLQNGTKGENWTQQQLIGIDIDNDNEAEKMITPEKAIELLKEKGIKVLAFYYTFSSNELKPKFRLLFLLKESISNPNEMKFIIGTLIDFIPQTDKSCKDLARLFYGTNKEVITVDPEARITLEDVINISKIEAETKTRYKVGNDFKKLIKEFDLENYMIQDGNKVCGSSSNWTYFKNCKICGHNDCLRYNKESNTFYCFGANGCKGGNIINYLMITKNLAYQEAVDYFKCNLLETPFLPEAKTETKVDTETKKLLLQQVKKQLDEINLNSDIVDNLFWVHYQVKVVNDKTKVETKIFCSQLANFIRNNVYYFFVRNTAKSGILRYFYLDGYYKLVTDEEVKGIIKSFIPLELQKIKDIIEVFKLLETDLKFITIDKLNTNQDIINFQNGILQLSTGELKPHSPDYISTIRIPCNYNKIVDVPQNRYFTRFINKLTNNDKEVKRLIYQIMGVTLSNVYGYKMKQAVIMVRQRKYWEKCH